MQFGFTQEDKKHRFHSIREAAYEQLGGYGEDAVEFEKNLVDQVMRVEWNDILRKSYMKIWGYPRDLSKYVYTKSESLDEFKLSLDEQFEKDAWQAVYKCIANGVYFNPLRLSDDRRYNYYISIGFPRVARFDKYERIRFVACERHGYEPEHLRDEFSTLRTNAVKYATIHYRRLLNNVVHDEDGYNRSIALTALGLITLEHLDDPSKHVRNAATKLLTRQPEYRLDERLDPEFRISLCHEFGFDSKLLTSKCTEIRQQTELSFKYKYKNKADVTKFKNKHGLKDS